LKWVLKMWFGWHGSGESCFRISGLCCVGVMVWVCGGGWCLVVLVGWMILVSGGGGKI
jgi:hypothetical protein